MEHTYDTLVLVGCIGMIILSLGSLSQIKPVEVYQDVIQKVWFKGKWIGIDEFNALKEAHFAKKRELELKAGDKEDVPNS